jgi:hypothetical protein
MQLIISLFESLKGFHLTWEGSPFTIKLSYVVSPWWFDTVSILSAEQEIKFPSTLQSPYVTFLPCFEMHGIFL